MSEKLRVRAAIVEGKHVVFYLEDGSTKKILQGDPRLFDLMAKLTPRFAKGEVVEIDLKDFSVYSDFEKKSNGFVRFFRTAKEKLTSFFKEEPEPKPEPEIGLNPEELAPTEEIQPVEHDQQMLAEEPKEPEPVKTHRVAKTYDEVKTDLKPIGHNEHIKHDESVVAVINGIVIPGIEKLVPYIQHSLTYNTTNAVHKFLERVSLMIHKRSHSVEDMFRFLEKGDLPLAEDGSIIAYKILRKRKNTVSGVDFEFVDCHTGNVYQGIGTYVRVKEELVDKNRQNECSNGLHIARRGYIGHFSGDTCTLIKLDPEDVITVPHNDANKIRVMGYKIIGELPRNVYQVLRSNKPMTDDPEAREMLAKAIRGEHIGVTEEVWIGGQHGTNLSVVLKERTAPQNIPSTTVPVNVKPDDTNAVALDSASGTGRPVDPVAIQQQFRKEKAKVAKKAKKAAKAASKAKSKPIPKKAPVVKTGGATLSETARMLYNDWINAPKGTASENRLAKLKDFQKKAKKGWQVLGFTQEEIDLIKGS